MKRVIGGIVILVVFFACVNIISPANALTYQDEVDIKFTFNSTLSIALSNDALTINNLVPGNNGESNSINVIVNTNNVYGYLLSATVGSSTKNYRDLKHTDGVATFSSIDVGSSMATITGTGSLWGFSKSTNGTTWSNYSGLPKYDDTENSVELNSTEGAAVNSITGFKIGAKAAEGQLAGDYTNIINFIAVAKAAPPSILNMTTLQDFGNLNAVDKQTVLSTMVQGQAYELKDSRDNTIYNVAKLADGKVWLLDNLRLDLTNATVKANLTSSTTNASDTSLNYLKNGGGTTSDQYAKAGVASWTSSNSFSAPLINTASKNTTGTGGYAAGKYGVYYNYCAATAGSYCYGNGTSAGTPSGNATEDICPKGWRMPTSGASGEYKALYTAYNFDYASFVNALRTPLSGYFIDGSADGQGSDGGFWSSTRHSNDDTYILLVDTSVVEDPQTTDYRYSGNPVRCILSN